MTERLHHLAEVHLRERPVAQSRAARAERVRGSEGRLRARVVAGLSRRHSLLEEGDAALARVRLAGRRAAGPQKGARSHADPCLSKAHSEPHGASKYWSLAARVGAEASGPARRLADEGRGLGVPAESLLRAASAAAALEERAL